MTGTRDARDRVPGVVGELMKLQSLQLPRRLLCLQNLLMLIRMSTTDYLSRADGKERAEILLL